MNNANSVIGYTKYGNITTAQLYISITAIEMNHTFLAVKNDSHIVFARSVFLVAARSLAADFRDKCTERLFTLRTHTYPHSSGAISWEG